MRFCPWYSLAEAAQYAPAEEGVVQLRIADGLIEYPTGKSAMVHYAHAADVRAYATQLSRERAGEDLLCRHLEIEAGERVDAAAFHAKVTEEFIRRFGREPTFPPCISSKPRP